MQNTKLRIEDALMARVAAAAQRAGKSAHAFILDAISQAVVQVELEDEAYRVADKRRDRLLATGKSFPWEQARVYLVARASGRRVHKPVAIQPAR